MTFYHGSPVGGLNELKPFSFYPYGFDENGNAVYSEYYDNAFYDLYKGKSGYLYECDDLKKLKHRN